MSKGGFRICVGGAVKNLPKSTSYAEFRRAVLEAGRFSVWEAGERPLDYSRLCHDPEVFTDDIGFPWTMVRARGNHGRTER